MGARQGEESTDVAEPHEAVLQLGMAETHEAAARWDEAFVHYRNAATLEPRYARELSGALERFAENHRTEVLAGTRRMESYVWSFLSNQGNPQMNFYPGLSARPFHDPQAFALARALENASVDICREVMSIAAKDYHAEVEDRLVAGGAWDVVLFYERGKKHLANCSRCPTVTRIIESHATVRTQAGLLYASKLNPGAHISCHCGPTNMRLRCHLGIEVPSGDCGIRVGGQTQRWVAGKCLVFDDSLEHESWNLTMDPRIVLIIDIWHPDLTPAEITYLEGLHRFVDSQAKSLYRGWSESQLRLNAAASYD